MKNLMFKNVQISTLKPFISSNYSSKSIAFLMALLFLFTQAGFSQITCGEVVDASCLNNNETFQCIDSDVASHTQYGSTLLSPVDALTTPQFLLIKGVVSFTQDYTFASGSEIVFLDNDSGFRVLGAAHLKLESSSFHGCTKLWKGIEVIDLGALSARDCSFEDAKSAITLRQFSNIEAVENTFSKNVCGILATTQLPLNLMISVTLLPGGISGNTFDGGDLLLEPSDPISIDPGIVSSDAGGLVTRPYVGIWLRGITSMTLGYLDELFDGTNDVPLNTFQNYGFNNDECETAYSRFFGIRSIRSNLEVRNSIFSNIGYYNPENSSKNCQATAIYATNSEIVIPDTRIIGTKGKKNATNTFSNCIRDILTVGTNLEVKNVTSYKSWVSIQFGMKNSWQNAIDVRVKNNDITFYRSTGIMGSWFKPIFVKIKGNLISDNNELDDPLKRTGILLRGNGWIKKPGGGVIQNTIISNSVLLLGIFSGIVMERTPNMFITRNTIEEAITGSNLASFIGIRNEGGPSNGMTLAANTINGAQINYPLLSIGVLLRDCSNTKLYCNNMDNINAGMLFFGDCDNSDLYKNNFGYHNKGLALGDPEINSEMNVVGLQKLKLNKWLDPETPIGAFALNEASAMASIFEVNEDEVGSLQWPGIIKIGPDDDMETWFQTTSEQTVNEFECGPVKPGDGGKEKDKLAHTDKKILQGTYTPPLDYPALEWEAKWFLSDKLNRTPTLLEEDINVTDYFEVTFDDSYSHLNRIYQTYRNMWQTESPASIESANLEERLKLLVTERLELNQQLSDNSVENEALYSQMAALDVDIEGAMNSLSDANMDLNAEIDQTVNGLLLELETVNIQEEYEEDMKAVIKTMLELHFSSEEMTTSQSEVMQNIADKCRYKGGYAVALARGFFEPQDSYPQDLNCDMTMNFSHSNENSSSAFNFNIYPNPAKSILTVEVKEKFEKARLKVYNHLGTTLKNVNFTENKMQLSVADLAAGIYFVEVETDQQKAYRQTFIKVD